MFESERRDLSWVPRWGILRVNRRQSVADHLYFTTCYGLHIAEIIRWPDVEEATCEQRNTLVEYLLRHDEGESIESDIPQPVKAASCYNGDAVAHLASKKFGMPAPYTGDMRAIRVTADVMDECMYLAGELRSGNATVRMALHRSMRRLRESALRLPTTTELRSEVEQKMVQAVMRETGYEKDVDGIFGYDAPLVQPVPREGCE